MSEIFGTIGMIIVILLIILAIIACWLLFYGAIFYIIYLVLKHIGLIGMTILL